MTAFASALARVLKYEGGFVNNPADRGGATNRGITQATYDAYRDRNHRARQSVQLIAEDEVEDIYFTGYWTAGKCIAIESGGRPELAQVHFDACVNHGLSTAAKLLQRALGVSDDGVIGNETMAAIAACDETRAIARLLDHRMLFYARIVNANASQHVFMEGWIARAIALRNEFIKPAAAAAA